MLDQKTVGRKKRKRAPGSGSAVAVSGHKRTPRGPNRGKSAVSVSPYKRGKPANGKKRKR